MPSIPQSLLWISLVVLWLFVLVPMLISKRDAVRRTSDVALATRVLNGGAGGRLLNRRGPAAGHRSDPDWTPRDGWEQDPLENEFEGDADRDQDHDTDVMAPQAPPRTSVVVKVVVTEPAAPAEPDYLDVDVVEDSAALPAGVSSQVTEPLLLAVDGRIAAVGAGGSAGQDASRDGGGGDDGGRDGQDRYEYVEDESGLEPEAEDPQDDEEFGASAAPVAPAVSRRRRFDNRTAAAVSARKYAFRKRLLTVMSVVLVGSATAAFEVSGTAWWICGAATAFTVIYLAYLRRQTRIEERVRRRRAQRMARARLGVENARDREFEVVPSRLRRPGAVVLEIDDEDPIFEHLENAGAMRTFGWPRDLPRAVGE
jgi:hypothetical protein